jgi:uncharacterized protein DUF3866
LIQRLILRRGRVVSRESEGPAARVTVDVGGELRPAVSYTDLVGSIAEGDDVVVNTAARDLGLGSGGFDVVHVNLTRGLDGSGDDPDAHVMKLNYTSLQHPVRHVEEQAPDDVAALNKPVAVIALHGQLPCVAWAAARAAENRRIGYVHAAGGALAGGLSDVVRELLDRGLLAAHVTAGPAFGGTLEAITVAGALHAGLAGLGWDAAIVGPGPGILGSATALGHGGLAALDAAHAALALGCRTIVVPRMSSGDPRPRHRGLSHHTRAVLELLLRPAFVALPAGEAADLPGAHEVRRAETDLDGYRASRLPAHSMGRGIDEDELFFRSALAGGTVLGEEIARTG